MSEILNKYGLRQEDEEADIKKLISESKAARNYKEITQEITSSLGLKKPIATYSQSIAIITNEDTATKALDHSMAEAITFVTAKLYEIRDKTARGLVSASDKALHITASGTIKAEHLHSTDDAQIDDDLTVSGDINANGAIVGDNATDISGIRHLNVVGNATLGNHSSDDHTITGDSKHFGDLVVSGSTTSKITLDTAGHITASGNIKGSTLIGTVATATQGTIDHDSLANFVSNKHIDHSGVSITAGNGLTGGGTIASTRDIAVGAGTGVTVNANDIAIGQDVGIEANVSFNHITSSGNIRVSGSTTTAVNIDTSGHITASGNISASKLEGILGTAAQSNITSLGTLTGLSVAGNVAAGAHDGSDILYVERFSGAYPYAHIRAGSADNNVKVGIKLNTRKADGVVEDALVIEGDTREATFANVVNCTALNTGQGDYELYAMNQNVRTSDTVVFTNQTVYTSLAVGIINDEETVAGHITCSGAISSSGVITGNAGANAGYTVRPNLYFFATNTSAITMNGGSDYGAGTTDNEGSLPATQATTVTLSQEQNSHTNVFSLSSNRVTIARAGLYKITYNALLEINNGSNRIEGFVGLVQETSGGTVTLVDGTEGRGYHRFVHSARPSAQTYAASVIVNVAANSIYDLRFGITKQSIATQKLRTMPTGTSFLIEAIT